MKDTSPRESGNSLGTTNACEYMKKPMESRSKGPDNKSFAANKSNNDSPAEESPDAANYKLLVCTHPEWSGSKGYEYMTITDAVAYIVKEERKAGHLIKPIRLI